MAAHRPLLYRSLSPSITNLSCLYPSPHLQTWLCEEIPSDIVGGGGMRSESNLEPGFGF
uniref:Uncharacterized protein n=1 Tax=Arundo donax TaxID=35708 RepID=A0A0A9ACN0_ARUDO